MFSCSQVMRSEHISDTQCLQQTLPRETFLFIYFDRTKPDIGSIAPVPGITLIKRTLLYSAVLKHFQFKCMYSIWLQTPSSQNTVVVQGARIMCMIYFTYIVLHGGLSSVVVLCECSLVKPQNKREKNINLCVSCNRTAVTVVPVATKALKCLVMKKLSMKEEGAQQ